MLFGSNARRLSTVVIAGAFAAAQLSFEPGKGGGFALVPQHDQKSGQLLVGFRMQIRRALDAGVIILPGMAGIVGCAPVDLGGGEPVAKHLGYVAVRHAKAHQPVIAVETHIDPVFKVVLVAPLVVQPGAGDARLTAGFGIGAVGSGIKAHPGHKFAGTVLAQVVEKALFVKADAKAVAHHERLVAGNGQKMVPAVGKRPAKAERRRPGRSFG